MTALAEVFARLTSDPAFADEIRRDPSAALGPFGLDASEFSRLELALGSSLYRDGKHQTATD